MHHTSLEIRIASASVRRIRSVRISKGNHAHAFNDWQNCKKTHSYAQKTCCPQDLNQECGIFLHIDECYIQVLVKGVRTMVIKLRQG